MENNDVEILDSNDDISSTNVIPTENNVSMNSGVNENTGSVDGSVVNTTPVDAVLVDSSVVNATPVDAVLVDSSVVNDTPVEAVSVENNANVESSDTSKTEKKKKKSPLILIILLLLCGVFAYVFCFKENNSGDDKVVKTETPAKETHSQYRMSDNGFSEFDISFLKFQGADKNIVYSPLSIKYALAMLSMGANGESKTQIDDIIGDYVSKKYINSDHMSFANSVFVRNTVKDTINTDYLTNVKDKLAAEVIYDDFNNASNVNKWVSDKTFNMINDLLDDGTVSDSEFLLINALGIDINWNNCIQDAVSSVCSSDSYRYYNAKYFNENYSHGISSIEDNKYPFLKFNGDTKVDAVEFGADVNNYNIVEDLGEDNIRKTITEEYNEWKVKPENKTYAEDTDSFVDEFIKGLNENYHKYSESTDFRFNYSDEYKVFAKDLKEVDGTTLEYVAIMPTSQSLDQFVKKNDSKRLNEIANNLKSAIPEDLPEGKVVKIVGMLPLFKYEYSFNLQEDFEKLGIMDVFNDKSDLSNLTSTKGAKLGSAKHKAKIEFSNEGIKAAAATSIGGLGGADSSFHHFYDVPVLEINLDFDKPFVYIIRDKNTKENWFIGTVYEVSPQNS